MPTTPIPLMVLAIFFAGTQAGSELPRIPPAVHCPFKIFAWRSYYPGSNVTSSFNVSYSENLLGFSGRFYGPRAYQGSVAPIRPCSKRILNAPLSQDPHDACSPEAAKSDPNDEFFYHFGHHVETAPAIGFGWGNLHLARARWMEFDEVEFESGRRWRKGPNSVCSFVLEDPSPEDKKRSVMTTDPNRLRIFGSP